MAKKSNSFTNMDYNDIDRILRKNGYTIRPSTGNHVMYVKGNSTISIPGRGRNKDIHPMLIKRIFKENNIIVD